MLVMGGCHILSTAVALLYILEQSCSYKYDEAVVYRQSLCNTTIIHMYNVHAIHQQPCAHPNVGYMGGCHAHIR